MKKVITYGTFDLFHYGHLRLLQRAKELGDYLVVGVTSDDYDNSRGKINNQQSLMERILSVKETGLADEIIVEEYEGQKIDDIKKYGIDVFTVGSDWVGKFDYLKKYCEVIYLDRTEGISSSEIRAENRSIKLRIFGDSTIENKFKSESKYVNGVELTDKDDNNCVYVYGEPEHHYEMIKQLLNEGQNVLCESPIATTEEQCNKLFTLASEKHCILFDGIKTAYSTAFNRLLLLVKSGKIGQVLSVDATCTSMRHFLNGEPTWNSICSWGPTALLPIFQLLGTDYISKQIVTKYIDKKNKSDCFTKIDFIYKNATASIKVANAAKSEGELVITGTKGYVLVPSPWWKTEYFEVRFENPQDNKRYFYQLDGEGIRYEISAFSKTISNKKDYSNVSSEISRAICKIIEDFYEGKVKEIL